jgi:TonB-linked SusC/RagA family outer membrane protein
MRKLVLVFLCMFFAVAQLLAQSKTVTGKVTDKDGKPIEGVSIVTKGDKVGTATAADGTFKITTAEGETLTFSSVGFQSFNIKVGNQSTLTLQMETKANLMEEVIVTAGGIKTKKKELGTASTVVKSEVLTAGKATSVANGLQGKVAGLMISGTGGGVNPSYRLVLRGQRSLTGNNQALLVLDNIIVPNSFLGNLNPEDVEDIVVLNGAGAAALYGSQASNGAIIVTTKKGKRGQTYVGFSNTYTVESTAFFPKFQEQFGSGGDGEYVGLENQSYGDRFDGSMRPIGSPLEDGSQDSSLYAYNDGHLKFWEKGITNQSDLTLTTGDENSTFYLSGQYVTTTGTTPGDKFNRASLRINGSRKIGDKINVTYTSAYVQNRYDQTNQTGTMYNNMLNMPSNIDITKYKNWRTDKFANPIGFYNPWYGNPYFTAENNRAKTRNDYLTGSFEIKYTPIKGLDLTARQGITTRNNSSKNTTGAFTYSEYSKHTEYSSKTDIIGSVSDFSGYETQLLTDIMGQYVTKVSDFDFKLLGGFQMRQDEAKNVSNSGSGLVVPGLYNLNYRVGEPGAGESNFKARQFGYYADLRVGYKGLLYLHGTARKDWVSVLAPANRTFFYPSVDLSFMASDAFDFIKNSNISYLKLRAGWSKVGQVNLSGTYGAYQLAPTAYQANGFPYGSLPGFTLDNTLVSGNLKPEITQGYEGGFDLNLFKDRFTSSLTWFSTKTNDQTVQTTVSNTTGFTSLRTNAGQTFSKGLEVTAHVTPFRTYNWDITVGGNYTYLDNKVDFLTADLPRLSLTGGSVGSYALPGYAFPTIMGFDYKRDPQGRVIVDKVTGLPTRADTISILGSAVAKHKLSLDGNIKYKNFTLSFLFEYRGGYQVYNGMGPEMDWSGTGYRTGIYNRERFVFPNSVYDDGTGKYVQNTDITIKNASGNAGFWSDGINRETTSNYVTSGDFWKLRELAISYTFSRKLLNKVKVIKGASISAQGRNLLMWMAKDNYYTDPEYSNAGTDGNGIGISGLQTPPSRYVGATISLKF